MLESVQEREMPKHLIGGLHGYLNSVSIYKTKQNNILNIYSILYNLLIKLYYTSFFNKNHFRKTFMFQII